MSDNVIDLLIAQHREIKAMFAEVPTLHGQHKQEKFEDLVRLLAVHESAEEQVVHPIARHTVSVGTEVVAARLEEESEAKTALADLWNLGVHHRDFDAGLADLARAVASHAEAEESQEFSQLRENLKQEQLTRMAGVVKAAEAVAPTRPHPMAGESAMANMVMGPPAALFDRVRDAVRDWNRG
jgi:hemerythrin superfamily protein